ncbi:transmembrane protein 177 [Nylanderia fulva]|uniref:transmembrane protein 177 n=1 Tax=Nylanderia fulva TaxID=613905 RepID=UPI0010FB250B|nr:transmembrane protein 177 [Nylanderia fulva]
MKIFSFRHRNLVFGVTATVVGCCTVLTPHTILLNQYRYIRARYYQIDKEAPLGSKMHQTIQDVMNDLKLPDDVKSLIKPFNAFGFDLFHAGSLYTKYGAILGIPVNFTNAAEQLRENLQILEEPIDWTRQDAKSFLKSTTLSENAQKFAIANEILRIQTEEPLFSSFLLGVIIAGFWTLYNSITYKYSLHRNVIMCRTLYSSFTLCGILAWFGIKDYRTYNLDSEHDEALCKLGPEYVKGGQEFYEKLLSRNRALRSLLGNDGKRTYTAYGNEHTFLRQRYVPISHRKAFFDLRLNNLNNNKV